MITNSPLQESSIESNEASKCANKVLEEIFYRFPHFNKVVSNL